MLAPRRVAKVVGLGLAGLTGLLALALAAATIVLQGERLGALAGKFIPPMKGKIEVRAVRWSPRAFPGLLTDRPTPISVDGLKITDPEGTTVLDVPHLDVKVPLRSLIGGDVRLMDLVVQGPAL